MALDPHRQRTSPIDQRRKQALNAFGITLDVQRWGRYADAIARWEHITGRLAPSPALLSDADGPRPAPAFVEWLMGLPTGWVTDHGELTQNQQINTLGNGVLPSRLQLLSQRSWMDSEVTQVVLLAGLYIE